MEDRPASIAAEAINQVLLLVGEAFEHGEDGSMEQLNTLDGSHLALGRGAWLNNITALDI